MIKTVHLFEVHKISNINRQGGFMENKKKVLKIGIVIGIIIMLVPLIITGHTLNNSPAVGSYFTAQLVLWIVAPIIGLIVMYDSLKNYYK